VNKFINHWYGDKLKNSSLCTTKCWIKKYSCHLFLLFIPTFSFSKYVLINKKWLLRIFNLISWLSLSHYLTMTKLVTNDDFFSAKMWCVGYDHYSYRRYYLTKVSEVYYVLFLKVKEIWCIWFHVSFPQQTFNSLIMN